MSQVKHNIIDKINALDDENLITALDSILEKLNTSEVQKLKKEEKGLLKMGLEDYRKGETMDDIELRREEDEWLKK